jgi:hypothetical protein
MVKGIYMSKSKIKSKVGNKSSIQKCSNDSKMPSFSGIMKGYPQYILKESKNGSFVIVKE